LVKLELKITFSWKDSNLQNIKHALLIEESEGSKSHGQYLPNDRYGDCLMDKKI
jgi:hypothetical protein